MTTTMHPDHRRPCAPATAPLAGTEPDELDDETPDDETPDDDELDEELLDDEEADDEVGQATTEYALVLLGAALVALLLIGWATSGGGAGKVGHLLDAVLDAITSKL